MTADLNKLWRLSDLFRKKFPDGNNIYMIMTRLLEESGELAQAVNHMEGSGVKIEKLGVPSKENVAQEIRDVLRCAIDAALHYDIGDELEACINEQLGRLQIQVK